MAFPASYVNGRTMKDHMDGTITLNLDTDTIKVALFTDAVTGADKNASESYGSGAWASNEVSSANYTAGGQSLANPTLQGPTGGVFIFKDSSVSLSWNDVTFDVRGALVYDSTVSNRVLAAINFGENKTVSEGTFTIFWDTTNFIFNWSF